MSNRVKIKWTWTRRSLFIVLTVLFGVGCFFIAKKTNADICNVIQAHPWGMILRRGILFGLLYIVLAAHILFDLRKLYDFVYERRFWLICGIFSIMVACNLNYSSMDVIDGYVQTGEYSQYSDPVIGTPRDIRSDEWMVTLPRYMSTDFSGYGKMNNIVRGTETTNMSASGLYLSYSALAHPADWGFYLFGSEYGLAWNWNFKIWFGLLAVFELCMILTGQKRLPSLFGAVLIWFSQYVMWWSVTMYIFTGAAAIVFAYYLLKETNRKKKILYGVGFGIFFSNFVVDFYPAWQVPAGFLFLALALAIVIKERKSWLSFCLKDWGICIASILFSLSIIGVYLYNYQEYMTAIMNTVYPGTRANFGGYDATFKLLHSFSSILSPVLSFGNPAEMGCLYMVYPLGPVLAVITLIRKKGKSLLLWFLSAPTLLLYVYCSVGLPEKLATLTMLSYSMPERAVDVLGLAFALMLVIGLGELEEKKLPIWIGIPVALLCVWPTTKYELSNTSEPLGRPYVYVLTGITVLVLALMISRITNWLKYSSYTAAVIAVMGAGLSVNPIMCGTDAYTSKPLYREVVQLAKSNPEAKWIAIDNIALGNYLIACGAPTYNSVNYVPNLQLWEILDPDGIYNEVYNRYAHMVVSLTTEETWVELEQQDYMHLYLSVEDLDKIEISYICGSTVIDNPQQYGLEEIYHEAGMLIYKNLEI